MFDKLDLMLAGEAFDASIQMALDEILLRKVTLPMLRIYRWEAPCVTFGYFQKIEQVRATYPALPVVRRWTGGGMVEHGKDLTFSLMIPKGDSCATMPPVDFYRTLHGRLAVSLSKMASSAIRLAGEGDLRVGPSCFSAPAPDDLLLGREKILGGAQRRSAGALLYQGSLQGMGVFSMLPDPMVLALALSSTIAGRNLMPTLKQEALDLAESRYRRPEWNGRR